MVPEIEFQLHVAVYEMNSNDGYHGNKLLRYFATVGKDSVFDYPKGQDTTCWSGIQYITIYNRNV